MCSPLSPRQGPSSRHCSAPAVSSPPPGGWGWSGRGSWWCTGPGQCHKPEDQSEVSIVSHQPIRGQCYLRQAPDDSDGSLEAPLQQLGTEGLVFGLDVHTGGGRQQLLPGELGQLRPPLGHRRLVLVRHHAGADVAPAPQGRPHPLTLGDHLGRAHVEAELRLGANLWLLITLTGLELDPLQRTDPHLAHLDTDPVHLLLLGHCLTVTAALLALAPCPPPGLAPGLLTSAWAASRQSDLEAARAPVAVIVSAQRHGTRLKPLHAGAVILKEKEF